MKTSPARVIAGLPASGAVTLLALLRGRRRASATAQPDVFGKRVTVREVAERYKAVWSPGVFGRATRSCTPRRPTRVAALQGRVDLPDGLVDRAGLLPDLCGRHLGHRGVSRGGAPARVPRRSAALCVLFAVVAGAAFATGSTTDKASPRASPSTPRAGTDATRVGQPAWATARRTPRPRRSSCGLVWGADASPPLSRWPGRPAARRGRCRARNTARCSSWARGTASLRAGCSLPRRST